MEPVSLTMTLAQKPKKIPAGNNQRASLVEGGKAAHRPRPIAAKT